MPPVTSHPQREFPEPGWSVDTAEGASTNQPPRELYRRLKFIAGLLKDTGSLPQSGHYLLWRDEQGRVQHRLVDRDLVIGRAPDCDIVLKHPKVSRRHCWITLDFNWVLIEDLGSTHGTKIERERITDRRTLRDGDVFDTGGARMVFVANSENEQPHA